MERIRHLQERSKHLHRLAALFVGCLALVGVLVAAPAPAFADGDYSMPKVDIQAELGHDGTLSVTETRTWKFAGDFTCVWWEFDSFGVDREFVVDGVTLNQGGAATTMDEVPFQTVWRTSGTAGPGKYSVDDTFRGVYVFFEAHDEQISVELRYHVKNMITRYADCSEVYWKAVGSDWGEDSNNVNVTLTLPCPEGTTVTPGNEVRGWSHGPLDGVLTISDTGELTVP
jgi:hypothetical protein